MIKIGDGNYYITCGEACLVMRERDGGLDDVCFGRRVEFEDDITALGVGGNAAFGASIVRGGKNIAQKLKLESAEVVPCSDEWAFPLFRAEKALKVTLVGDGLGVELFFTPHTRGGISRRCAIVNTGAKPIELRSVTLVGMTLTDDMKLVSGGSENGSSTECAPTVFVEGGGAEGRGEAIGLYPMYGGRVEIEYKTIKGTHERRAELMLPFGAYALGAGERFESPEVLCAYSDRGVGGLARTFHDIVRENFIDEKYAAARRPIAFYSPAKLADQTAESVRAVGKLGADTFVVDVDAVEKDITALKALGVACADAGVKLGVHVALETVKNKSTAEKLGLPITDKITGKGVQVLDLTAKSVQTHIVETVDKLVGAGVSHITLGGIDGIACADAAYEFDYLCAEYALLAGMTAKYPDVVIAAEAETRFDIARLKYIPYFGFAGMPMDRKIGLFDMLPPCATVSYVLPPDKVKSAFKTDFDIATTGGLSYIYRPENIDEHIALAIRAQIFSYQDDAELCVCGDLYRFKPSADASIVAFVSKDKARAYVVFYRGEGGGRGGDVCSRIKFRGLDSHNLYHVREIGKTFSGAALAGYGIDVSNVGQGETAVFHLRQVVDYEF